MKQILVGVDGSAASAAALRFATQFAVGDGAEIIAVHAYQHPYAELSPDDRERRLADCSAVLDRTWVRPAIDAGVIVHQRIHEGDPREIVDIANFEGADLLVLGRTGSGTGPGLLHLGSVVEYAAHHVHTALAVIPPYVALPFARMVIGVDGSREAASAIDWCVDHRSTRNADVLAVFVEAPVIDPIKTPESDGWREVVEHEIVKWTSGLAEAGVSVTPIAKRDIHPADGLVGVAAAHRADVLVIGTRGAGRFSGIRVGGVAMKVLHHAALPIVLVPPTST
ncbi:MAG: nucleotide-binding universal stress UspA family protein [Ilumatobacter sp.]|jgi:nucleotide-binding universal stress UspA family protein